jgi:hypothetical protein
MAGNESFGAVGFEFLLDSDKDIVPFRRPRVSVRTIPGSNKVITNFGGYDPYVMKGTLYTRTEGKAVFTYLNNSLGAEQEFSFRGRTGRAILTVMDDPRLEHEGDALWVDVEFLLTRW